MMIAITDVVGTSFTAEIEKDKVGAALHGWYVDPPEEITKAIDDLQDALNRGDGTGALEAYLGIKIDMRAGDRS